VSQLPETIYAAFSGNIDVASSHKIVNGLAACMAGGVKAVHLFFHSSGGAVGDGIALYNFFRAMPIDLTIYNPGIVASVAAIAYLGGRQRKTSPYASFMVHRTRFQPLQPAQAGALEALAHTAVLDDRRTEEIIRACTTIPDERLAYMNNYDLWLNANEAVEYGIAQEKGEFSPPFGAIIRHF
jgi:ATP-dependent Clp protease protease subunit